MEPSGGYLVAVGAELLVKHVFVAAGDGRLEGAAEAVMLGLSEGDLLGVAEGNELWSISVN